jgi:hypothetical protein
MYLFLQRKSSVKTIQIVWGGKIMKIVIIYHSRSGNTQKITEIIGEGVNVLKLTVRVDRG